jgi:peptide/nickel transport system ATP-binding protein
VPVLSVRDLSIDYITRRGPVHAVRDVSFELEKSETLAIIGESGSGKTTLAVGLIRLSPRGTKVTSGEILYTKNGLTTDVRTLDDDDLREYRWAEAAMVFQAALNSFNPVITIWEQFNDTARAHGMKDRHKVRDRADELLDLVHLDAKRILPAFPHELSGGMKQRVEVARALAVDPDMLYLDEPFGALDSITRLVMRSELLRIWRTEQKTILFVTHDIEESVQLADRVVVLTARPAQIRRIVAIDLPHPRDLSSRRYLELRDGIFEEIGLAHRI